MVRVLLYISILIILVTPAMAQDACEVTLTKAQEEFDAGRFHGVPNLLKECLEKNQDRGWEQRAYLLLAQTYLLLEDPAKADESYLKVLGANPEYLTDETRDPIDLVYLSKKFTATPIFSLTARAGLNTSFIRVIHDVDMYAADAPEDYSLRIGWQAGLGVEYHYNPEFSLTGDAMLSFMSFNHEAKNVVGSSSLSFTDKQSWITLPLMVKYTHGEKALRPFASLGYSPSFLLSDKANIVTDGVESEEFDYKNKRNTFNSSLVLGAGLKYKLGLRYIFGEVRYSVGLFNVVNGEDRYDSFDGINMYRPYADDDFRMDNLYVSIGYVHPFYKARQLKKARTKTVLRKTRKTDGAGN